MSRSVFCLAAIIAFVSVAAAHEMPEGDIERCVQVCVEPTCVVVQYTLGMSDETLGKELRRQSIAPAETLRKRWQQYQQAVLPSLAEGMTLSVGGEPVALKPYRTEYLGWRHRHVVCYFRADVRLARQPKKIVLADGNFWDAPGGYRLGMESRVGASMANPIGPVVATRSTPTKLAGLSDRQKGLATRAEGAFHLRTSPRSAEGTLFPEELVSFVEAQEAPVFSGTGRGTWDHAIRERGCILRHSGKWHLWYTGYRGGRGDKKLLGYATSADGFSWERHPVNPVFDQSWTEDVHVTRHAGKFYMVAEGRADVPHLLTSPDGIEWAEQGRLDVRRRDGTPLSPGPCGTPTLLVEGDTWYLFYERGDRGVWLARSTDLATWTNTQDEPVIARGPAAYDRHAIALNQVIRCRGRYYGVYHANADPDWQVPWTTCLAVSDDLLTWTKYPGNPIIRTNNSSGQLVHDGQRYRLYTMHPDVRAYVARNASK
ncbi:MAG: hypothetical protein AAF663_07700 [Planctomycetota bacterium]